MAAGNNIDHPKLGKEKYENGFCQSQPHRNDATLDTNRCEHNENTKTQNIEPVHAG